MKTPLISLFVFFISLTSFAQTDDGKTMGPILKDALNYIETVESKGYEIVRIEFDILKTDKETFRTLSAGWTYDVYAFGDYRFQDLDVSVYKLEDDGSHSSIPISTSSPHDGYSRTALVTIKPLITASYEIVIKANSYTSDNSGGHYGLIIFHE